jgi:ElaB/YqjD/DUF883 family membrane-anchored ribosome-binding protein
MATPSKTVEIEDLQAQFDLLRNDLKDLTDMVGMGVKERAALVKDRASDQAAALRDEATEKALDLHREAEQAVRANPLMAVALIAGVGFLLGAAARR